MSGTIEAPSRETVVSQLQSQGFIVTNVETAGSAQRGTVDFAARLEGRSTAAVDYAARLKPSTPRARPLGALAVCAIFGGVGVAILRAAGWPPPVAPAIVAAVFLLLSLAILAALIVGLLMPGRVAAGVDALKRKADQSRRRL